VVVVEVSRHISPNGRGIPLVDEIFKVISYLFFHLIGSQAGGQGVLLNGETSTNLSLILRHWGLRAFFVSANQTKFLQLVAERVAADVEQLGGVGLVAVSLPHGEFDHRVLDFLERGSAFRNVEPWQG